jgi:hypothetical protein
LKVVLKSYKTAIMEAFKQRAALLLCQFVMFLYQIVTLEAFRISTSALF